jgi:L-ascorbate oxidase
MAELGSDTRNPMTLNRPVATLCVASLLVPLTCGSKAALAIFAEPAVFASEHGVLGILMIAKPKPIPSISFTPPGGGATVNPLGWVYEVCR